MAKIFNLAKDFLQISLLNFKHKKKRTVLTMLGIIIGIAAVVSLISMGQGLQDEITSQFEALGSDKIFISPGSAFGMGFGSALSAAELTDDDIKTIRRVRGIKRVAGMTAKTAKVSFGSQTKSSFVTGMQVDLESKELFESISSFQLDSGRWPKPQEKNTAAVGYKIVYDTILFDKQLKIGDSIKIENEVFNIVGVVNRIGNDIDDTNIMIPIETSKKIFGSEKLYTIFAQVREGTSPEKVAGEIKRKLRKSREVKEGGEDFSVLTPGELLDSFNTILAVVQAVVVAIASISLFTGGVGIMNTMYTSVLERTREIGIMKAVGAKNEYIMAIFTIESGVLGLAGGLIGVALGAALSKGAEFAATAATGTVLFRASLPPELLIGALAFSFIIGVISGILPARKAASLDPVDALRYE
ncbi:MAG: ABC transporter permease [Candidatus Micrarchaeia archaeon]